MPARKKSAAPGVGQALIRHRFHRSKGYENADVSRLHTLEDVAAPALVSEVDRSDLDELLQAAELADRDFAADRGVAVLDRPGSQFTSLGKREQREQQLAEEALLRHQLTIPRRPEWTSKMTTEQLAEKERRAFLAWRQGLARLEENEKLMLTPFEKNLDIWRQLWRVVERSDVLVAVVDARNPLFYRCPDLEAYVKELDSHKRTQLLLNKADLLPISARQEWAAYFLARGISFIFWSAKMATDGLESKQSAVVPHENGGQAEEEATRILGREELLARLKKDAQAVLAERRAEQGSQLAGVQQVPDVTGLTGGDEHGTSVEQGRQLAVVGFVGYPNVGKSSTINALVGQKKTGVTSTPGKTKHFQTLLMGNNFMLCDCPGLVFPSFAGSRSEMVAAGVLPVDRLTDHRGPIEIVAERIPREVLIEVYGLKLPAPAAHEAKDRPPTAAELLRAYARSRGYVGPGGLPDETRASRQILKDYLNGRLLDYYLPPDNESRTETPGHVLSLGSEKTVQEQEEEGHRDVESDEESVWEEVSDEEWDESLHQQRDNEGGKDAESATGSMRQEGGSESKRVAPKELAPTTISSDGSGARASSRASQPIAWPPGRDAADSGEGGQVIEDDFDALSVGGELEVQRLLRQAKQPVRAAHKLQKKGPRRKDRTWRVGYGGRDDSDGMPIVGVVQRPLSHGATRLASVLPEDRHLISS